MRKHSRFPGINLFPETRTNPPKPTHSIRLDGEEMYVTSSKSIIGDVKAKKGKFARGVWTVKPIKAANRVRKTVRG